MSLQVCYCGWSKVTTYHGLRIHQGRKGCTPKGVKFEESDQQYMWEIGALLVMQEAKEMDPYTSIKTDTAASDMSLQVCHCGWSKVTTYIGLRSHQGMMGCTPKGMRIPQKEHHDWESQRGEVDQRKYQPATRTAVKKESMPLPPSTSRRTNSAPTTAPVKLEYKPPNAKPRHQLQHVSTGVQVNRLAWEHPTPAHPDTVVRPKERHSKDQSLSQTADGRTMTATQRIKSRPAAAATIKQEPVSPLAMPQRLPQRATNSTSGRQPQDLFTGAQVSRPIRECPAVPPKVNNLVRERSTTTYPAMRLRTKENHMGDRTFSQNVPVPSSLRSAPTAQIKKEPKSPFVPPQSSFQKATNSRASHQLQVITPDPTTLPLATVFQPKEKDRKDQTLSQAKQERVESELRQKVRLREEKMSEIIQLENPCRSVPDSTSTNTQKDSAAAETKTTEEPKTLCEIAQPDSYTNLKNIPNPRSAANQMNPASADATTEEAPKPSSETAQLSDFSSGLKVKDMAQMFSDTTTQETAVRPKEKHTEKQGLSQSKHTDQKLSATTAQETAVRPKEEVQEDQNPSQNIPDSTSAANQINAASAEATTEEDPKPSACETAQLSSGLKVKQLARMFSATTTQETAVRPKEKHTEKQRLPQAKLKAQKLSATTPQETAVHPMDEVKENQNPSQKVPESTSAADARAEEAPKSSVCETAQLSSGLKVKQLAQMFSATTTHETVVRPKQKHTEKQRLSQNIPDSTAAANQMNPASAEGTTEEAPKSSCETAQLSDDSTGLKVKDLARMFSATTIQETAVRLRERHRVRQRLSQWM